MSAGNVGEAFIEIVPHVDAARFERILRAELGDAAEPAARQLSADLGSAFGRITGDANVSAERVTAEFRDAASDIERAFDSTAREVDQDFDRIGRSSRNATSGVAGLGGSMRNLVGGIAVVAGARAAIRGTFSAIGDAADLGESINAINVLLGDGAESFLRFGESASDSLGITQAALNEAVVPIASILANADVTGEALSGRLQDISTRATDVASVFNADVNEVLTAFGAAIRGEAEPARRFGVNLNAARIEAEAFASGIATVGEELTQAQKIQAAFNVVLADTQIAAGDFANTANSLPNLLRRLSAAGTDVAAQFGQGLLGGATEGAGSLLDAVVALAPKAREFGQTIADDVLPPLIDAAPVLIELAGNGLPLLADGLGLVATAAEPFVTILEFINDTAEGIREIADAPTAAEARLQEFGLTIRQVANESDVLTKDLGTLAASFLPFGSSGARATAIDEIDRALADLVRGGHPEQAEFALNRLLNTVAAIGGDPAGARQQLDDYTFALQAVRGGALEAEDATDDLAGGMADLGGEVGDTVDQFDDLLDRFADIVGTALDVEKALSDFEQAVDDLADVTEKDGVTSLDLSTEAGRRNRDAFRDLIDATFDRVDALRESGAADAVLRRTLQEGERAFREQGEAAGFTKDQIDLLLREYEFFPDVIVTELQIDADAIAETQAALQALRDFDVNLGLSGAPAPPAPTGSGQAASGDLAAAPQFGRTAGVSIGTLNITETADAKKTAVEVVAAQREAAFLGGGG